MSNSLKHIVFPNIISFVIFIVIPLANGIINMLILADLIALGKKDKTARGGAGLRTNSTQHQDEQITRKERRDRETRDRNKSYNKTRKLRLLFR